MLRYLLLVAATISLAGCQSNNPYQAESVPLPPAPSAAATHFDPNAYPAASQQKTYSYWCWFEPAQSTTPSSATQEMAQQVLAEQLEQYALRPAATAEQCELKVQLSSQQHQRIRRDYYDDYYPSTYYSHGYGRGYHDRYRYSGIGVDFPIGARTYTEHYQQLHLIFTDAVTSQTIWQTQSQISNNVRAETSEKALRDTINRMLQDYN